MAVTARPQMVFAIDTIPAHVRENVVDKLIKGQSSRDVSAFLLQQGHKISHNAVARYNKLVIQPALKIGAKLKQLEPLDVSKPTDVLADAQQTLDVTKAALRASPILAHAEWLWDEARSNVVDAKAEGDVKGRSSAILAANKTLETQARAMGDPNFVAGTQAPTGASIQIAIITAPGESPRIQTNAAIDVDVVEIERQ